jgi:RNA polymerase sigma-70 factor (ECF subfamily)
MVRNHHDAEEICQDAFLKAFGALKSYSGEFRFSTWLFTIAYRVCLNRMRRRKIVSGEVDLGTMPEVPDLESPEFIESEEAARLKERVWSAVDQLSPPQRASILLFYRFELGCHEIARVLELPIATVKSHLHRARLRLRELLETVRERDLQVFRIRAG